MKGADSLESDGGGSGSEKVATIKAETVLAWLLEFVLQFNKEEKK
jgi:hypothetical protein